MVLKIEHRLCIIYGEKRLAGAFQGWKSGYEGMLDLFKQINFKYLSSHFQEHLFAYKKNPTVLLVSSSCLLIEHEFICQHVVNNFSKQAGFSPTFMSFHWTVPRSLGHHVPG